MFLRIGETVRSAQFARFVDVDREPTRHLFSADLKALDLRTAPRLALPGCGDAPARFGFCGVLPDALDQGKQIADIDAVDDRRLPALHFGIHERLLCLVDGKSSRWIIRAWRALPGCADPGFR